MGDMNGAGLVDVLFFLMLATGDICLIAFMRRRRKRVARKARVMRSLHLHVRRHLSPATVVLPRKAAGDAPRRELSEIRGEQPQEQGVILCPTPASPEVAPIAGLPPRSGAGRDPVWFPRLTPWAMLFRPLGSRSSR
jgi:hypothetical protein